MNVMYSLTEHNSVQVLSINSLLDEWQNHQILKELQPKIDSGFSTFVVDLTKLNLVNSAGLNFLLSLFSKTKKQGGSIILANASRRVKQILEMTKLSSVFTLRSSVEHAVDCFEMELVA